MPYWTFQLGLLSLFQLPDFSLLEGGISFSLYLFLLQLVDEVISLFKLLLQLFKLGVEVLRDVSLDFLLELLLILVPLLLLLHFFLQFLLLFLLFLDF